MKVFTVALLFAILASSYGYSYIIPASMKHPGICYFNGHVLQKGDNQMPTACQNMRCNDDGSILVQGCGQLDLHKCTLLEPAKLDKQYPDCCEMTYRCKDDDGNMVIKQWNQLKNGKDADSDKMADQAYQLKKTEYDGIETMTDQANEDDKKAKDA